MKTLDELVKNELNPMQNRSIISKETLETVLDFAQTEQTRIKDVEKN